MVLPGNIVRILGEDGEEVEVVVAVWLQTTHLDVGASWQVKDLMFARVDSLTIACQGLSS